MTAIAVVAERGRVVMACDSEVTTDTQRYQSGFRKAWRAGRYVVGGAGLAAGVAALRGLNWNLPLGKLPEAFTELMRALREHQPEGFSLEVAVGAGGRIYLWDSGELLPVRDRYLGLGSGGDHVRGHLAATVGQGTAEERVVAAVKSACRHCSGCGGPVRLVT